MKGVIIEEEGKKIYVGECEKPKLTRPGEALVKIHATAVNRADISQRYGNYPPPPGASTILGLEMAGVIEEIYEGGRGGISEFKVGDKVCGLLAGGGYAEYCVVPLSQLIPIPPSYSFVEAAGLPEAYLTAYQALFYVCKLDPSTTKSVMIHAAGSGVGIAAIQLVASLYPDIDIIATAGSANKLDFAKSIGAKYTLNYKETNNKFADEVTKWTNGRGVDIIVDFIGASYWEENIQSLAIDGRLVLLSFLGGPVASSTSLSLILKKRLSITGSTLRARSEEYKSSLVRDFYRDYYQFILDHKIKVFVDKTFPIEEVDAAHQYVSANLNTGKVCLLFSS